MARAFASRIISWQRRHGRHGLPWQSTRDPYRVWLSEIMLQQTQVATVLPYYLRFVTSFPDVLSLARAPIDTVLAHWSGLGYYRRAHHLHRTAQTLVARHGGRFPHDTATLATLPGIGRSTAAAIAVFAFGAREAILDGNVKRVLARHRGVDGWPGAPKVEARLWDIAYKLRPARDIEAYTQGLMDLGSIVCTRAQPRCDACPVAADCIALSTSRVSSLPSPRPKKTLPQRALRVLLIERRGEFLVERRPLLGVWGGLWSLPECTTGENAATAVRARFGAQIELRESLLPIVHRFTHFALTIHPQRLAVRRWPLRAETSGIRWLAPSDVDAIALPAPIGKLLRSLVA
ncbi:MAG: A/G-specific adenine glycosylase [Burkholderiales bacterium]|nr:A/G-specific adenine glycosylase [Burkholderiales bacterium]